MVWHSRVLSLIVLADRGAVSQTVGYAAGGGTENLMSSDTLRWGQVERKAVTAMGTDMAVSIGHAPRTQAKHGNDNAMRQLNS